MSTVRFEDWTTGRTVTHYGTNAGHIRLPFQTWRKVKEAFAPEIVARAIRESAVPVQTCVDPFAGSGTTALACQFLGVSSTSIEVNPYLADLIRAKLADYDVTRLREHLESIMDGSLAAADCAWTRFSSVPPTLIEPGSKDRWVFDLEIVQSIGTLLDAIDLVEHADDRRFFRIVLSGILLDVSNVIVNGKGRRYRRRWAERPISPTPASQFRAAATRAISEIEQYSTRASRTCQVLLGSASDLLPTVGKVELAVFSPPYPNSFDYTDIYNVELWMLGYLSSKDDNRALRLSTMPSHVQLNREFEDPPRGSLTLDLVIDQLADEPNLWNPWIPAMVGAYFNQLSTTLQVLHGLLASQGCEVWMVIGDSRYGRTAVQTSAILTELAPGLGFSVRRSESTRSLRSSAQQGGQHLLPETLLVLSKVG